MSVDVHEVVPCERVAGLVRGDLSGPAQLELRPAGAGSEARLTWDVELTRVGLRRLERIARPAMEWGHDVVVGVGVRRFRRRAVR